MDTRNRAILIILAVILFMSGVFLSISLYEFKKGYTERLIYHEHALEYLVESEFQHLTQTYTSRIKGLIKANVGIRKAFANSDREALIEHLSSRFNTLRQENQDFYDISFYLPDGKLYISMNDINAYGADMSAYPFIQALNNDNETINGFIVSNGRLFFQVAMNIHDQGKRLGIIEFKIHTTIMNETIKKVLESEYGLSVIENSIKNSPKPVIIDASSAIYEMLPATYDPGEKNQKITVGESTYIIHSKILHDFKGDPIGFYLTSDNVTELQNRYKKLIAYTVIITMLVIILSSSVLYVGFGAVLKNVETLNISLETKVADRTRELEEAKDNAIYQNKVIGSLYKRFKSMFQDHRSIMFLISKEGNIVDANNAASDFFKLDREELLSLTVADVSLLTPEDVKVTLIKSFEKGLQNYVSKFKLNDIVYDIEIQGSPIEMDGQTLLFAICHDVTEKIAMETRLKEMNKNLEQLVNEESHKRHKQEQLLIQQSKMSSVGEILSAIIHQWKQPMTAISYIMQDIADAAERGQADNIYLSSISSEALAQLNYMNQTVEDFRSFLMPSKSKEAFNIAGDIKMVVKMLIKHLDKDNINLNVTIVNSSTEMTAYSGDEIAKTDNFEIDTECFKCFGYANEFKQVLMNILNNARDAIVDNKIMSGSINIVLSADNKSIEISIADNAGGIPSNIIDKVFDPYFTTKPPKGTGIGLYMAKSIIEDHMNGKINVENSDKGAIFKIILERH